MKQIERLDKLVSEAKRQSDFLRDRLNSSDCLTLAHLFRWDEQKSKAFTTREGLIQLRPLFNVKKKDTSKANDEIKGFYVLGESNGIEVVPVYVGISGKVIRRLRQHTYGKRHNQASLAYLMAKHETGHQNDRAKMGEEDIKKQRGKIKEFKFTISPIEDDFDLYFLEVCIAGILNTKWNSFKTH